MRERQAGIEKERDSKEGREMREMKREREKRRERERWKYNDVMNAECFGSPSEKIRKVNYTEWKGKYTIFLDGKAGGNI